MLKAFFSAKYLKFCSNLLGHVGKRLDNKDKIKQIITAHILPIISRSKGNQTMKFGQLIEYNIFFNIFFLKNHTQNVVRKLVPDPFIKNLN